MSEQLKPCPFCGSHRVMRWKGNIWETVYCDNCSAAITKAGAITAWNRRGGKLNEYKCAYYFKNADYEIQYDKGNFESDEEAIAHANALAVWHHVPITVTKLAIIYTTNSEEK